MRSSQPTMRDIATKANVGLATVSLALRDSPKISEATRVRIKKIAMKLGYRPDPLVSAYQARVRSLKPVGYQATIAWIDDFPDSRRWRNGDIQLDAARARAKELGYALDVVRLEGINRMRPQETVNQFCRILRARGIHGAILPRLWSVNLSAEEWPDMAIVLMGHAVGAMEMEPFTRSWDPHYHEVGADNFYNVTLLHRTLRARGFKRIGMAITKYFDTVNDHLPVAAFQTESSRLPAKDRLPVLICGDYADLTDKGFGPWINRHQPDVVIFCNLETVDWCKRLGLRIPEDISLAHAELSQVDIGISGIDPRSELLAASAVDMLTAHLQRNERGLPTYRKRMLIPGVWRDGQTVRFPDAAGALSPE